MTSPHKAICVTTALVAVAGTVLALSGCAAPTTNTPASHSLAVVATTTQVADFSRQIAGTAGTGELVEAFRASGTTVACLCSSDKIYLHGAEPVSTALREAGATHIWLAGKPGEVTGVDGYLFTGVDALSVLRTTLDTLGVK